MSELQTVRRGGSVFERHNGGGLKERFAQVSNGAFIGPDCEVLGNAELFGSPRLLGRAVVGPGCKVSGSVDIKDSYLSKGATLSDTAQIFGCHLSGDVWLSDHAVAVGCQIECKGDARIRIGGNANLNTVTIKNECFIEGDADIQHCTLAPGTRIYGGQWMGRAPRVVRTKHPFDLCESAIPGNLIISCQDRPIDVWIREGKRLGKEYGLKPEELEEYIRLVKDWKTYEEKRNGR